MFEMSAAQNANAQQPNLTMAQTPAQQVLVSPADRFGLLGLLNIIRMSSSDMGMLALGSDLTNLGLDLSSPTYVQILMRITNSNTTLKHAELNIRVAIFR